MPVKILDRLPYFTEPTLVQVGAETVRVKPYQIVVQVSVTLRGVVEWDYRTPSFPAIFDIGHNHHFSIRNSQFLSWTGLRPEALIVQGAITERGRRVPLRSAGLWLHRNVPGTREVRGSPHLLKIVDGIAVYPDESGPRLPLFGLRAVTKNELTLYLSGAAHRLSVSTPSWWSRVLDALGLVSI